MGNFTIWDPNLELRRYYPAGILLFSVLLFFPGLGARDLWAPGAERVINTEAAAYGDLKSRGLDQCGVTLLAGKAVGAPFVGMTAASLCLAEVLRLLHEGDVFAVHDIDLKSAMDRVSLPRSASLPSFNPGFTDVRPEP